MSFVSTLIKLVLIANAGQTSIWLVTWDLCPSSILGMLATPVLGMLTTPVVYWGCLQPAGTPASP